MDKTSLVIHNVKAFVVSWLTASLLFPLFFLFTQEDTTYLWGVVMMLIGLVLPYMMIPILLIVVLFNWIVLRNRGLFNNLFSLLLLGGLLAGGVFCIVLLLMSRQDMARLFQGAAYMTIGGGIFGFFYHYFSSKAIV